MAVEAGQEYNPETAKDLRSRQFAFVAFGERFAFTLEIPEYILLRINRSEVSGQIQEYMERYCETVITDAIRGGYWTTETGRANMRRDVGLHLKNYIWERFSITQERAGQGCWATAPTLQKVHTT